MKKYHIVENFFKENPNLWFNHKDVCKHIKITSEVLKDYANIGLLHLKKINQPYPVNYYKYNKDAGKWGLITSLKEEWKKSK